VARDDPGEKLAFGSSRTGKIKLSVDVMDYVNEETGYSFRTRLEERKRILEREIDRFGAVIRPLVVRAEDMQLMDGYCRYHVSKIER